MTLSDNIVVMNNGIIEQTGSPYQVYEHPRNRFVASFLGKANFFSGQVVQAGADWATLDTAEGTFTIPCQNAQAGTTVTYALRPEKIQMSDRGEGLTGTVTSVVYSGSATAYRVQCGSMELMTEERSAAGQSAFVRGDRVVLSWPSSATVLLED